MAGTLIEQVETAKMGRPPKDPRDKKVKFAITVDYDIYQKLNDMVSNGDALTRSQLINRILVRNLLKHKDLKEDD